MRRPLTVLLSAALIGFGLAGIAFGLPVLERHHSAAGPVALASASGAVRIANSAADRAILESDDLVPGGSVEGRVMIGNAGAKPASLTLAPTNFVDRPGPNGGGLAVALRLTVLDLSGKSDAVVYAGSLAGMRSREVALLHGDGRRLYGFVVSLPEAGVDNSLSGAGVSFDYRWSLTAADPDEPCVYPFLGDAGANAIVGSFGGDRVLGRAGADSLFGRTGNDCLDGGPGRDEIVGGYGDDSIEARDGAADEVDCGPGEDVASLDRFDSSRGCEALR